MKPPCEGHDLRFPEHISFYVNLDYLAVTLGEYQNIVEVYNVGV